MLVVVAYIYIYSRLTLRATGLVLTVAELMKK
jgi:hypothetical protein